MGSKVCFIDGRPFKDGYRRFKVREVANDDYAAARELHLKYFQVFNEIFVEPNPVPIKFLMKTLGLIESDEGRLPLCGLQPENTERITKLAEDFPIA